MPIRVDCPRCGRVTHYADNDAGLAAACISCKTVITVPRPQPLARPAPRVLRDPSQELHLPPPTPPAPRTPARQTPRAPQSAQQRTVQPATPRRSLFPLAAALLLLIALAATAILYFRKPAGRTVIALTPQTQPASAPSSRPATTTALASAIPPATQSTTQKSPVLASNIAPATVNATPVSLPREPVMPRGFIALDRLQLDGKIYADSYNSSQATYDDDRPGLNCLIACNGPIAANGRTEVKGSLRPGPQVSAKFREVKVTGSTQPLEQAIVAPPVKLNPFATDSANHLLPEKYFRNGRLNLYGGAKVTIPRGTYYLDELSIDNSSRLTFEGPATLYIHNRLILLGRIRTFEEHPANLRIRMTGEGGIVIGCESDLHLDLYGPRNRVEIHGKGDIFGSLVARTLHVSGSRNLHFDEALVQPPP